MGKGAWRLTACAKMPDPCRLVLDEPAGVEDVAFGHRPPARSKRHLTLGPRAKHEKGIDQRSFHARIDAIVESFPTRQDTGDHG
jgi:hypothetical protein